MKEMKNENVHMQALHRKLDIVLVQILPYMCSETDYSFCEDSPPARLRPLPGCWFHPQITLAPPPLFFSLRRAWLWTVMCMQYSVRGRCLWVKQLRMQVRVAMVTADVNIVVLTNQKARRAPVMRNTFCVMTYTPARVRIVGLTTYTKSITFIQKMTGLRYIAAL